MRSEDGVRRHSVASRVIRLVLVLIAAFAIAFDGSILVSALMPVDHAITVVGPGNAR